MVIYILKTLTFALETFEKKKKKKKTLIFKNW